MRAHKERLIAATRSNVQKLKAVEDDDLPARISRRKAAN